MANASWRNFGPTSPDESMLATRSLSVRRHSSQSNHPGRPMKLPPLKTGRQSDSEAVDEPGTHRHTVRKPSVSKPATSAPRRHTMAMACHPSDGQDIPSRGRPFRQTVSLPISQRASERHRSEPPYELPENIRQKWDECEKVRNAHCLRTILAEARNRHQQRASFQERLADRKNSKDNEPTLWRLVESSGILSEVLRDVRGAVRVCCKDLFKPPEIKEPEPPTEKVLSMRWQMLRELFAEGYFNEVLLSPAEHEKEDADDVWARMFEELASDGTLI